ncbi:asb038 [Agrotis segetum nucleopolyhedrovirus B]|uniref:Asb038 n=1 Tax=Agrotis segetum nucleopolyhedrovirus B TaxID=1580580 RepID=A0A0A7KTB7_9ABAC|nr:asb038 [Agrotis segetum nucleopolyhedrovirus B]AIZ48596.1 asb038 [Agrotis segetum nucleopolyhedrovirus B]
MNNVTEALELAMQFERLQCYKKAISCLNLAIHFLTIIKSKRLNATILQLCDAKILECVQRRRQLQQLNDRIVLKKYVLLDTNIVTLH